MGISMNMPRLSRDQRQCALGMLQGGLSYREVTRRIGYSHQTISALVDRDTLHNSADDRPRWGRPRVTTARQDRQMVLSHLRDRFRTASRTAAETQGRANPRISNDTARRRLHDYGLTARRPYRGPVMTAAHRRNRQRWCQQHQRWTLAQWNEVAFSDESRFCVDSPDGRERVWRRTGERYADCCVRQANRWGGPSVMVWAAISGRYRTPLVVVDGNLNAQRYVDNILRPHLLPFLLDHPELITFQHDNTRPHAARFTTAFLQDLNPIEHLWDELGRRVVGRARTRAELLETLRTKWGRIQQQSIQRLVGSMRRRCTACIQNNGGHTRYWKGTDFAPSAVKYWWDGFIMVKNLTCHQ